MGPLQGLSVVEVAGPGPGPMAGMLLADQGAEVVRVERPAGHDTGVHAEPRHLLHNRGKRHVELDLKEAAAVAALNDLIGEADVLIEGFRPGVAERMGFGPDTCLQRNPRLVYARITGWGQDGPLSRRAGHDLNFVAAAGVLGQIGPAGGAPTPPLNLVGDFGGGALYAAFGILAALHERSRSGHGQVVDVSMVEGALSLMTSTFGYAAAGWHRPERGTNLLDGGDPSYSVYRTADDRYVTLGAIEDRFFAEAAGRLGLEREWIGRRHDRTQWPELRARLSDIFARRTSAEWCAELEDSDCCFAPVLSLAETETHPQLAARGSVVRVDGVLQPGVAPRFSRSVASGVQPVAPPPPSLSHVSSPCS